MVLMLVGGTLIPQGTVLAVEGIVSRGLATFGQEIGACGLPGEPRQYVCVHRPGSAQISIRGSSSSFFPHHQFTTKPIEALLRQLAEGHAHYSCVVFRSRPR